MIPKCFCQECGQELTAGNKVDITGFEDLCHGCYTKLKPVVVCLDFDGVVAQYTGWKGPGHCGEPLTGLEGFLMNLINWAGHNCRIIIHTTRKPEVVFDWLATHGLENYIYDVTNTKPAAVAYIDDRAICFRGSFTDIYHQLIGFKPWWKPGPPPDSKD